MTCPHGNGNPHQCSQCLQVAGKLKVKVQKVPQGMTGFMANANFGTLTLPSNKAKRCVHCRKAGHKSEECRDYFNQQAAKAVYN